MKRVYCLMMTVGIIFSCSFAEKILESDTAGSPIVRDTAVAGDSVTMNDSAMQVLPLCTLSVTTDQSDVTVKLDGEIVGVTPVNIVNIATGKHVLVLQKSGFYQKKVVITINEQKNTPLHFSLTAPGMLSVISEPPGAALAINGVAVGDTPLTDSLMKPGTYQISLSRKDHQTITDSVTVIAAKKTVLTDTLEHTPAYLDSVAQTERTIKKKSDKVHAAIVGGAFGLFLLILAIIEVQE